MTAPTCPTCKGLCIVTTPHCGRYVRRAGEVSEWVKGGSVDACPDCAALAEAEYQTRLIGNAA